jgi:DNA-binding GntR family transcriptional regulator
MSRPSTIAKRTSNLLLEYIARNMAVGDTLPAEQFMTTVCQASRTAVRRAIVHLYARHLINGLNDRQLLRMPIPGDYFDESELQSGSERIEQTLMEKVLHGDLQPGAEFSEVELARESGASTVSVREFLIGFSRYGLIEKKPRGGWRLCAFDPSFARELADMRQMFEFAAVERFCSLPPDDPMHEELARLIAKHERLKPRMGTRYGEFPALDREFHTFLIGLLNNRFAQGFYDIVSFVFHYHYQWEKSGERERNTYALAEHLAVLHALSERDRDKALLLMRRHLDTSRKTLFDSIAEK